MCTKLKGHRFEIASESEATPTVESHNNSMRSLARHAKVKWFRQLSETIHMVRGSASFQCNHGLAFFFFFLNQLHWSPGVVRFQLKQAQLLHITPFYFLSQQEVRKIKFWKLIISFSRHISFPPPVTWCETGATLRREKIQTPAHPSA